MDDAGQRENGRHRMDYYKAHAQWNPMQQQYHVKDQNALMNRKFLNVMSERDAAIEERDRALSEKRAALDERDMAIQERDAAVAERDCAVRERDNAIAALHFHENTMNVPSQRGTKRAHHSNNNHPAQPSYNAREAHITPVHITPAYPISAISAEVANKSKRAKANKGSSASSRSAKKGKKVGEDLNRHVTTDGSKAEWDAQEFLMNQIDFDESTMPIPVCSCTGVSRQCYKWGSGGWQSSCCTTTISVYPLPQMPNKRHARMGGRKMSGTVFTRLLSRLAAQGHDLSIPLDLKNYWAKHGTNRYITIK